MKKKKILLGICMIILVILSYFIFSPKYYSITIKPEGQEINASGILTESIKKNSLYFSVNYIYPDTHPYFEIYSNNEFVIGFGFDKYVNLIENKFFSSKMIEKILKNKDDTYLISYDNGPETNITGKFKIELEER